MKGYVRGAENAMVTAHFVVTDAHLKSKDLK